MGTDGIFLPYGVARLRDSMGDDLDVVNCAKVSYDKRSKSWGEKEESLLAFLASHGHESPFRHQIVKFEVYCPLMVARQWWKYRIGSSVLEQSDFDFDNMEAWNESSRRYVTEKEQFYMPNWFRLEGPTKKQGSGANVLPELNAEFRNELFHYATDGLKLYKKAMAAGICPEQARLFLPAYGLYIRFIWTVSLLGLLHFLTQRLNDDAQVEIQEYARDCAMQAEPLFPNTFKVFEIRT